MVTVTMDRMRDEVAQGLARSQKRISPKFFYDRRGSELFERITRQPEYYPTRAERRLLRDHMPGWISGLRPESLVELGAGAADKTTIILDAMHDAVEKPVYVPIDISGEFLDGVASTLRDAYPAAEVRPVVADMTVAVGVPTDLPRPALFALLGGTIGNFPRREGVDQLRRARSEMGPGDRFLLGCDLQKDVRVLEAAYNDAAGVTAAFNLNVLTVLNRELGADFDPADFRHHAFYNRGEHQIEMHLVARRPVTITLPGAGRFHFRQGESLHTEVSCKYDRPGVEAMLRQAGLSLEHWAEARPGFALLLARPV
ncbi:MAG: L-histidine N(alpha)-methyltransferase [Gemmatimonadota bacterium]